MLVKCLEQAMGYIELIEKLQTLPRDKQAEVFDFVEFLAARFTAPPPDAEWTDGKFSEFSLGQALRGMEDDPVSYTTDDLSEKWA
jgi:hypothetical protein